MRRAQRQGQEAGHPGDSQRLDYGGAIEHWTRLLGSVGVSQGAADLKAAETATFRSSVRIPAILRPGSTAEVQGAVRIANRFRIPVYTVSTGRNWGNGSSVPASERCVVMSLERMKGISNLNEKLAHVTIEPGVTQGMLSEYLIEKGDTLWADINGSSRDCSIIGNIMERGIGHSAYGNRISRVCGLEIVLANGDLIKTGFGKFGNAHAASVYPWGVGPSFDGLFSQSNLGIVTGLTLWLMPKPEYMESFFFSSSGPGAIGRAIDALQPLRLRGVLQSAVHLANNYKVVNAYSQFPFGLAGGKTPLPDDALGHLSRWVGCGEWNGCGALYGTGAQVKEARRLLKQALRGKADKLRFISKSSLALAERFPRTIGVLTGQDLKSILPTVCSVFGMQQGVPSDHAMASAYWRKPEPPPAVKNPDLDGCGLIWYCPVAPLEGSHAESIYLVTKAILLKYAFEPLVTFVLLSERAMCCVIGLVYDRDLPGGDERALECHYRLVEALSRAGYYPYRLGIQNMKEVSPDSEAYSKLYFRIKEALDPHGILSPGRYEI